MLSRARYADEGEKDWRGVAGGDEELHREATGLQRALHGKIFPAHWNAAAVVAGSGQGLRSRLPEIGQTAVWKARLLVPQPSGSGQVQGDRARREQSHTGSA